MSHDVTHFVHQRWYRRAACGWPVADSQAQASISRDNVSCGECLEVLKREARREVEVIDQALGMTTIGQALRELAATLRPAEEHKSCRHCGSGVVWSDLHPEWTIDQPLPLSHQ